jgi:hypothetical protein
MPYLRVGAGIEIGEGVSFLGYPQGRDKSIVSLAVARTTALQLTEGYVLADCVNSAACAAGSPLVNQDGRVVAILSKDFNNHNQRHLQTGSTNVTWFRCVWLAKPEHHMPQPQDLPSSWSVKFKPTKELKQRLAHDHAGIDKLVSDIKEEAGKDAIVTGMYEG